MNDEWNLLEILGALVIIFLFVMMFVSAIHKAKCDKKGFDNAGISGCYNVERIYE